jgi:hypothetical protein
MIVRNFLTLFFFRYVYKFVCDPEALFQMALAENHRAALKLEATAGAFPPTGCQCYERLFLLRRRCGELV